MVHLHLKSSHEQLPKLLLVLVLLAGGVIKGGVESSHLPWQAVNYYNVPVVVRVPDGDVLCILLALPTKAILCLG
jgi:hypothetical protein